MKIHKVEQNSAEWHELRLGRITGSKLKDVVVKRGARKLASYQLIADRLCLQDESGDSSDRERGHELEQEAIEHFMKETGKKVEVVGFVTSSENDRIALSPDAVIKSGKKVVEAVEAKCLSAARHIQAIIENKVPDEFKFQVYQYFIVLPDLEMLHFVFYDPRIGIRPYHCVTIHRWEVEAEVEIYRDYQNKELAWVEEQIEKLTF